MFAALLLVFLGVAAGARPSPIQWLVKEDDTDIKLAENAAFAASASAPPPAYGVADDRQLARHVSLSHPMEPGKKRAKPKASTAEITGKTADDMIDEAKELFVIDGRRMKDTRDTIIKYAEKRDAEVAKTARKRVNKVYRSVVEHNFSGYDALLADRKGAIDVIQPIVDGLRGDLDATESAVVEAKGGKYMLASDYVQKMAQYGDKLDDLKSQLGLAVKHGHYRNRHDYVHGA